MNIVWAMGGVKVSARDGRSRVLLPGLLAYLLCRGLLLGRLLPPWQGADEPGHAEMALLVAREGWPRDPDPALQADILADMRAARFFGRLDEAVPAEDLRAFVQVPRLRDAPSQVGDESPVGYLPLALAAAAGDPTVPGATLARLRLAALAMALLWVLALYWAGSRIGGGPLGAALATAAAFLPLGGLASATAAPDLVPALFAALWLGSLPVAAGPGRRGGRWRVLRLALAGLAALSKRSGLFLVPLALAVEAWAWRRGGAAAGGEVGGGPGRATRLWAALPAIAALATLAAGLALGRPTAAAGWQREGRSWGAVRSPAAARTGDHGFRVVDVDGATWQYLLRWVDLPGKDEAGRAISLRAWVRAAAGQAPAPAQVAVTDGRGAWWGQTVTAGAVWSPVALRFTLPAGVDRLRLALVPGAGTAAGRGGFDFDDVAVWVDGRSLAFNGGAERPERWGALLARGLGRYLDAPRLRRGAAAALRQPLTGLRSAWRGLAFLLASSWGGYGWLRVWPGPWAAALGQGLGLFMAVAGLGALLWPRLLAAGPRDGWWLRLCGGAGLLAVLFTAAGTMLGAVDRLPQGRYLLPAYPFLVLPALALAERRLPARGPWLLCALLLALDLWTLLGLLWPAFGGAA